MQFSVRGIFNSGMTEFDKKELNSCGLLSVKPKLYVCNVDEKSIKKFLLSTRLIETFLECEQRKGLKE